MNSPLCFAILLVFLGSAVRPAAGAPPPVLPGTEPLRLEGDIASNLVAGVDRFLLRKISQSEAGREAFWHRDFSSPQAYQRSIETNRDDLAAMLGLKDVRPATPQLEMVETANQPALIGFAPSYQIFRVRWRAFDEVCGEGLLLLPETTPLADVIALPDAGQTPEQLVGLQPGIAPASQIARRLADSGCRVLVPVLISRESGQPKTSRFKLGQQLTNREFIYRPAFELGRTMVGYEVEKVMAAVDWCVYQHRQTPLANARQIPIGVVGWGEGGLIALYAAAADPRIDAACVSGYFQPREELWNEPIDRNVFGLLKEFGDAELASLVAPRPLVIEAARGVELTLPSNGGAPATLATPELAEVRREFQRAQALTERLHPRNLRLTVSDNGSGPPFTDETLSLFLQALNVPKLVPLGGPAHSDVRTFDIEARQDRQLQQLDRHNQAILRDCHFTRDEFMKQLDTSSPSAYQTSSARYRKIFYDDVIGHFDDPLLPANPRTRLAYQTPGWTGYEVMLDVFPDVIAYGILLLPNDLQPGEKRPVVVCQHGLEGRARDVVEGNSQYYHDFAARLAEQGFITFAPQNLYIFHDRFRTLQRKSYPLGKTLFSTIIPQHQQILDWLKTLPNVDPKRLAFYGLSYGGKTAMRVPAVLTDYCLSICSADFNEWVWKNASTHTPYSYAWMGEYEIFEFNLGSTFNYAEMASLIAPRPFMVERGHFDGVAPDNMVADEYAKVRFLYEARLGLRGQTRIEFFTGPHTIHGEGTFDFLHQHLNWPPRPAPSGHASPTSH